METANSLSGGKTSSFLSAHYPADYEIFSIVCVDDPDCAHPDKKVMQYVNDKIEKYCAPYGEVIGTCEDPVIFKTMMDLEQFIGREIIWVRDISFDQLIQEKQALPNKRTRVCTTTLKMAPIFKFCFKYIDMGITPMNRQKYKHGGDYWCKDPVRMRVGYRYDEKERMDDFTTSFEIPMRSRLYGEQKMIYSEFHNWRKGDFVMIREKVVRPTVNKFWQGKSVSFADDSNCQHCFWKPWQQKKKNWLTNPAQMAWASKHEISNRFDDDFTLKEIERMPLQLDFFYGGDAGCQAGACTN